MALSKPQIHAAFAGQHYLVCGIEYCERNCRFYCNVCHRRLCEQCRDEHLKNPISEDHEVVLFQKRKRQLPEQKCQNHPRKDMDMLCQKCQVGVCSKCATQNHHGHTFIDLDQVYAEKSAVCLDKIATIQDYFIPASKDLQKETRADAAEIKDIMENIRKSIKTEAESLKSLVDIVSSDKVKQVNEMESSILETLKSQDDKYEEYTSNLSDVVKKLHRYISSTNPQTLMKEDLENLNTDSLPETVRPVPPVFTAGKYSKEDISNLLGKVAVTHKNPEKRKIKPIIKPTKTSSTQRKLTQKEMKSYREKPTLSLSSYATKVGHSTVSGVDNVNHVSVDKSRRHWVSDDIGNLVQTDLQGNLLQKIKSSGGSDGYHAVTQDGGLIYTVSDKKLIYKITPDKQTTEFIKTVAWEPLSIHSSRINGDILVGIRKDKQAKVTRYNKAGEEIQNIQRNNKGYELYSYPHYITENINNDVCTSDCHKRTVVVVNNSGQHRFSYTGQESRFSPFGICTDILGHILVCDQANDAVHLLNQDGGFLSIILSRQEGVKSPRGVCVDDENNLYVGQSYRNTVTVYKYLQ